MHCLDDLVVLDLSRRFPPAQAAMLLGDFGARVIKVDPPARELRSRPQAVPEERYAAFNPVDRNKRSIVLDLKSEGGREVFRRLAKGADVIIEGFRPGVMERLGLSYRQLAELNPRLIYCAVSGFGSDGPYAQVPAHDPNYIAIGGALSLIGERGGRPYLPSNLIADRGGAPMHAALGILLAVIAREKTGRGQLVDVSYLDSVISLLLVNASFYFESGVVPRRGETSLTGGAPWAQVFRCKDGEYITIGPSEPHLWANLCRALGREDLIPYQEPPLGEVDRVVAEMAAIFETRTRDEWYAYLLPKDTCVGPVYTIDDTCRDPQVLHRDMVVELAHPTVGPVKQTGVPIKLSQTPGSIRQLGVPTGSDTEAVLQELGYDSASIDTLRKQGVLG